MPKTTPDSALPITDADDRLTEVLSAEPRFCSHGTPSNSAIVQAARASDPRLLELLLSDSHTANRFFTFVNGIAVFDREAFVDHIRRRNTLPDGFTAFKNKIGLSFDGRSPISDQTVVLVWPYKDAVLEGGQSKEDRARPERFLHTEIAADDIDRLFAPKALVDWQRWDADGPRRAESFSHTDNLIIRGNNLIALHSLAAVYRNRVKLIYIDPPYNTGSDAFKYNDRFAHSTWLTFMKNRLDIARELLREDGAIFIQVDDAEFAYLKVLCDEIFGRENHRETIVLKSGTESGVNAINVKRGERLFKVKEYILFYSKTPDFRFKPFYTRAKFNLNYKYRLDKENGEYRLTDMLKRFKAEYAETELNRADQTRAAKAALEEYALKHPEHMFSLEKNIKKAGAKFKAFAKANKKKRTVEAFPNAMGTETLVYDGGTLVPLDERVITDEKGTSYGVLAGDLWTDIPTTPSREGGVRFANGKKPEKLLHRIIGMATEPGDLVLDYHLGSGTTAAVAHKMKRRYIGIEQMDYGEDDATRRLLNVINGDPTGVSRKEEWSGGGEFLSCGLAVQNADYLHRAMAAATQEQLLEVFRDLARHGDQPVAVSERTMADHEDHFRRLGVDEMRHALIELIDSNDLYVAHAEMNDSTHGIAPRDRKLTDLFYSPLHGDLST